MQFKSQSQSFNSITIMQFKSQSQSFNSNLNHNHAIQISITIIQFKSQSQSFNSNLNYNHAIQIESQSQSCNSNRISITIMQFKSNLNHNHAIQIESQSQSCDPIMQSLKGWGHMTHLVATLEPLYKGQFER